MSLLADGLRGIEGYRERAVFAVAWLTTLSTFPVADRGAELLAAVEDILTVEAEFSAGTTAILAQLVTEAEARRLEREGGAVITGLSVEQAQDLDTAVRLNGGRIEVDGTADARALQMLGALAPDVPGHFDGWAVWIDGTAYPVRRGGGTS